MLPRATTGDIIWSHHFDHKTKQQRVEWYCTAPSEKNNALTGKVAGIGGSILVDFLPRKETVNAVCYVQTLQKLQHALHDKRPVKRHNLF
jgi:hypothetical protein